MGGACRGMGKVRNACKILVGNYGPYGIILVNVRVVAMVVLFQYFGSCGVILVTMCA
jgi:hypothetical protein